ncbi:MAG TPA: peptidylprolyl isomerase [Flavipsychrobacter sp.]|nr:peptidylprolyl isomerase [Flavipsychrobacter sp.]
MKKITFMLFAFLATASLQAQTTKVVIETDSGKIVMALYDYTPLHRDNMIKLVKEKFFDSTLFHRVIANFVIQGGDPESKHAQPEQMLGNGEVGYKVPAEINDSAYHCRGAVGMARDNNPEKASSGCQFYIVTGKKYTDEELNAISNRSGRVFTPQQREVYKEQGGTAFLDGNYTVYGRVVEGMDVVDKISAMRTGQADRPTTDIAMRKVYLLDEKGKKGKKTKK